MKKSNQRMAEVLFSLPVEEARKLKVEWSEEWKRLDRSDEVNFLEFYKPL